ncbi:hypothetical protein [Crocinitomix algicola]|uniref:hypothetical protein n=1 Tax=Crocinitomix algicola TaxID=1740263 RepID=UPI0008734834|nr:hypothetical protein [Crocinitomix algicola]
MKNILVFSVVIILFSCSKTPLLEQTDDLVGIWKHYNSKKHAHVLIISEDGSGKIEWEESGQIVKATKERDWYIKGNTLFFGKASFNGERYTVDEYPQVAWDEMINYYDTIHETKKYIILDGNYYVEQ